MPLHLTLDGQPVEIRELGPEDERDVLDLFDAAEDWFLATTGQPAAPGDVQSLYYSLPEGASFEQKQLLLVVVDGRLAGLVDAVLHHPAQDACAVGMFLLHPHIRRQGLGTLVARALLAELAGRGITRLSASAADDWRPGLAFLRSLGFTLDEPRSPATANRNPGPGERTVVPATLRFGTPS